MCFFYTYKKIIYLWNLFEWKDIGFMKYSDLHFHESPSARQLSTFHLKICLSKAHSIYRLFIYRYTRLGWFLSEWFIMRAHQLVLYIVVYFTKPQVISRTSTKKKQQKVKLYTVSFEINKFSMMNITIWSISAQNMRSKLIWRCYESSLYYIVLIT